ncbi:MAG: DUF3052 family protein [Bacteroidetes bacterium]|nr:MAG: DUF3052 family protein [Bacteroidota bacterium]
MKNAGYSGTPLAKKLGIKPKSKLRLINQPDYYFELFEDFPTEITMLTNGKTKADTIHYFATTAAKLGKDIVSLRKEMEEDGMLWISWYKKSSKIESDLNENIIREIALANGLVDVKVCAVDEMWSGLKLVIRVKERK